MKEIEVFALYGPSGTGKSHSALQIAHEYQIPAIIDDGLLIYQGRKIAGSSAKYEKTKIQAVKRAIFLNPRHTQEIQHALAQYSIERLLIVGTSEKMVRRIASTLGLSEITHYLAIEDVKSTSEIKAALYHRETQGKHVIPIPQIQVEKHLIRRFIKNVEQIFTAKQSQEQQVMREQSIVMPRFHGGNIHVRENVLKKMVRYSCRHIKEIERFNAIHVQLDHVPIAEVHVTLQVAFGHNITLPCQKIQQTVRHTYSRNLNLDLHRVDVHIDKIIISE